jgi:hypothetical protein
MTEIFDRDLREIFPDYIGFGLLDLDSLCIVSPIDKKKEEYARAMYRSREGDAVYDIKVKTTSCYVEEFYQGKTIGVTQSRTVESAFQQKFVTCHWEEHPRFMEIVQRIGKVRNVTPPQVFENDTQSAVFPAGTILILQFASNKLREKDIEALGHIKYPAKLEGLSKGIILRVASDNEVTMENCFVVQLSTIPLNLEEAINFCFDHDLVPHGKLKELGLHILYIPEAVPGSFMLYPGNNRELKAYSIILQREGDVSLTRALDLIKAALVRYGPIQ